MKSAMPSLNAYQRALFVFSLVALSLLGCQPSDSKTARIDLLSPTTASQLSELDIYGTNFGDWNALTNRVLINGDCADVITWSPTHIRAVIPSGIGTGLRQLEVVLSSGQRLENSIDIQAPDRPRAPRLCSGATNPVTVDPDAVSDTNPDTNPDIPPPTDVPPDSNTPDIIVTPDLSPPDILDPDVILSLPYYFVLIQDQSPIIEDSPGVDIDAVVLRKRNGEVYYSGEVREYASASSHFFQDPFAVIGPPDAFYAYPDLSLCLGFKGFTSLGGVGGYIILSLPVAMEPGDQLEILEVGACFDDSGRTSPLEPYQVSISPEPWLDGNFWLPLSFSPGGPTIASIPELP